MFCLRRAAPFLAFVVFAALIARASEAASAHVHAPASAIWSGWTYFSKEPGDIATIAALSDSTFGDAPKGEEMGLSRYIWARIKLSAPDPATSATSAANATSATSAAATPGSFALLQVGSPYEDVVELFVPQLGGGWKILRSGEAVGPRGRAWPGVKPVFPVQLPPPGGTLVVHARVREHSVVQFVVKLHPDVAQFTAAEQAEINENMLYFGLLAALFVYNFFLYLRLHYRDLLYYLIYLAAVGATMLGGTYTATLLFPFGSPLHEAAGLAALNVSLAALLLFVREFHGLAALAPRLHRWAGWVAIAFGGGVIAVFFDYKVPWVRTAFMANFLALIAGLVFVPVIALVAWHKGARQARFFLLAFGLYLAALATILLTTIGLTLPAGWEERIMRLGSALEMLLLSFAISDRFRRIRMEKEALQANYTAQLERDVTTRTRELQETAARLAASNADKDQLVAIIAHDVRTPLVSLLAVTRALTTAAPTTAPSLAHGVAQRTGALLALINNLLDWARLRTGQFEHDPAPFELVGIAAAALRPLEVAAQEKTLSLETRVPPGLLARADAHAVQSVLRNLVGNALKFTPAGGRVVVAAIQTGDALELTVADTGPGMLPDLLAALGGAAGVVPSATGTAGERGAGIGLGLCRDLLARDGGTLAFACPPECGTVATVRLPAAALS